MQRKDLLTEPVKHFRINSKLSVNQLIQQFQNSGSFGAGRLAVACDIYEKMARDKDCTIFLGLAGALVPAGMRSLIADLIRGGLINVVVSTGANMVHDSIEALGGHHYKGHWLMDDHVLYRYHVYRIYDVLVPEEDFVNLDYKMTAIYDDIADQSKGKTLSSCDFARELGKRLEDPDSILRAAYESNVPVFLPAVRDSELGYVHFLHSTRRKLAKKPPLLLDAFSDVAEIIGICRKSKKMGMIILGGGVPRNTIQSAALATKSGLDYAVVITMDRAETGGLSGSTLEETVSWGKVKGQASTVTVYGDAMIIFPIMAASLIERLGKNHKRPRPKNMEKLA